MYQNKDHTNQKHIVTKSNNIDISNQKSLIEVAKKISKLIKQGDNLFLYGELGVGKTTFVKSLINHLQTEYGKSTTEVLSPTFNILPYALALAVPPTSGATHIIFFFLILFLACLAKIGVANKLSTGISKNPCICPE